ncbi:predicted protein [Histoplasma capsulatum G186AR]|uniref:Uncharacterized protein n=1 Tax=Ajellomyces capsulatus (strain G186AR / H82 / ATCC MYA-2454 / RMSCC 2432) TaxID=447093 RepID=C0NR15_AJECG|nr:uncharacterized protein HCBG_05445 [Histoplasma capsulatum G186AR]EEH06129.1 predicted protein [Histoplasma capsulatum G186AR]
MPTIHSIHLMAENYTVLDGESLARIGKCVDRGHPAFPPNQTFPLLRFAAVYLRLRGHRSKKPMCKFLDVLETEFELALRMQNAHVVFCAERKSRKDKFEFHESYGFSGFRSEIEQ